MPNPSQNRQSDPLVALGDTIREARMEQEVSQEHLALRAEIDRSYMGRIERGDNNVTMLTLLRIADALGTTVSGLLKRAGY